ncbi:hypothetical protein [Azohydromonas aeria]|uniref:hypothetical protein n=1 Tax=Azohydromonas aeria TaxID=2590212 RepID=UPI0012F8DE1A|nr:hypothetical protein [Azohydromonas aeria]
MTNPTPFEIAADAATGARAASNGAARLILTEADGVMFRRRGVRNAGTEAQQGVELAVAEVNGVRVYFDGTTVIVSRADLYP